MPLQTKALHISDPFAMVTWIKRPFPPSHYDTGICKEEGRWWKKTLGEMTKMQSKIKPYPPEPTKAWEKLKEGEQRWVWKSVHRNRESPDSDSLQLQLAQVWVRQQVFLYGICPLSGCLHNLDVVYNCLEQAAGSYVNILLHESEHITSRRYN